MSKELIEAAKRGDIDAVKKILNPGKVIGKPVLPADVNYRDEQNRTALHWAARTGNKELVLFLIDEAGSDITAEDDQGFNALNHATNANKLDIQALLLTLGSPVDNKISQEQAQELYHPTTATKFIYVAFKLLYLIKLCNRGTKDPTTKFTAGNIQSLKHSLKSYLKILGPSINGTHFQDGNTAFQALLKSYFELPNFDINTINTKDERKKFIESFSNTFPGLDLHQAIRKKNFLLKLILIFLKSPNVDIYFKNKAGLSPLSMIEREKIMHPKIKLGFAVQHVKKWLEGFASKIEANVKIDKIKSTEFNIKSEREEIFAYIDENLRLDHNASKNSLVKETLALAKYKFGFCLCRQNDPIFREKGITLIEEAALLFHEILTQHGNESLDLKAKQQQSQTIDLKVKMDLKSQEKPMSLRASQKIAKYLEKIEQALFKYAATNALPATAKTLTATKALSASNALSTSNALSAEKILPQESKTKTEFSSRINLNANAEALTNQLRGLDEEEEDSLIESNGKSYSTSRQELSELRERQLAAELALKHLLQTNPKFQKDNNFGTWIQKSIFGTPEEVAAFIKQEKLVNLPDITQHSQASPDAFMDLIRLCKECHQAQESLFQRLENARKEAQTTKAALAERDRKAASELVNQTRDLALKNAEIARLKTEILKQKS